MAGRQWPATGARATGEMMKNYVSKLFLFTVIALTALPLKSVFAGEAMPAGTGRNYKSLPLPSEDTFLKAFGATISGGRVSFDKFALKERPRLLNFLVINGIGPDLRSILYRSESCGARAFQFVAVAGLGSKESLQVTYDCQGSCNGLLEKQDKANPGLSDTRSLPKGLCEGLWGGALTLSDVNGL